MHIPKHAHFIGIGGIGISAIARMLLLEGVRVSGSDREPSPVTDALEKAGAKVFFEQRAANIEPSIDLVVYTIAIPVDNAELVAAKALGVPVYTYPEYLGLLSKEKYTIAVAGTHGKTTTTAMIAGILIAAGLDPTIIVGSLVKQPDGNYSNFVAGKGKYLVVEACEYKRSFLNLWPKVLAITNIDNDHLDYYKDIADIQSAFRELAERVPADGAIIAYPQGENVQPALTTAEASVSNYYDAMGMIQNISLPFPGEHTKKNAAVALAVAKTLGIDEAVALKALENFKGTWRRFEFKGYTKGDMQNGAKVYDDYGHHPTEVKATLQGARSLFQDKKIIIAFHPHLFSRTKLLFNDFLTAFNDANEVVLAPIYPAREPFDESVSSDMLAEAITKAGVRATALADFDAIRAYLDTQADKDTVIITMGAGDIYKVAEELIQ